MDSALMISALVMGLLGSFHCIGMCGPLALSLPVQHLQGFKKFLGIILYNLGRVITYATLGFILGLIGNQFVFFGWQQKISIALGILFLLYLIFSLFPTRVKSINWPWKQPVMKALGKMYQSKNLSSVFIIGLLNGLLPCGLVYMALAGAFAAHHPSQSALFMGIFGLGTFPAMMSISFLGNVISLSFRNKIRKATPFIIGFMGLLLIVRGLNLGIPYLSPELKEKKMSCCEHK